MTKRRRHTPDQIIRKLAEGNKLLAGGAELDELCRHVQIAESTWHRRVAQYGAMKASDAKLLRSSRSRTCADAKPGAQAHAWPCPERGFVVRGTRECSRSAH